MQYIVNWILTDRDQEDYQRIIKEFDLPGDNLVFHKDETELALYGVLCGKESEHTFLY
jgi:hypothetical protein